MNICKECSHSIKDCFLKCKRGVSRTTNVVTGDWEWQEATNCITERDKTYGDCGPEGKYFEPFVERTGWEYIKGFFYLIFGGSRGSL